MYLKSIELSGFKSFGRKSVLDFRSPISAIVGPNGSGKSNIAEAFRFVLGEQSMKSMRGRKSEDLIWNGGKDAPRANRASVKLTLDNRRRELSVDFDEVAIERVVYRDASSEYFINQSRVRLRDIIELLAGAHIGASGHHIISQGEADKILSANSKERREMLEDALGLKIYQYKRLESERKLERTKENLKQVGSLRREIAPHLNFLKKQVEKVERALKMKEDLKTLYRDYLKREDIYIRFSKKHLNEEKSHPQKELSRLEEELASAKKVLEESKGRDARSSEVILLEEKLRKFRDERDLLTREEGRLQGEIGSRERLLKRESDKLGSEENRVIPFKEVEALWKSVEREAREAEILSDVGSIKGFIKKIKELFASFIGSHRSGVLPIDLETERKDIDELRLEEENIRKKLGDLSIKEKELAAEHAGVREEIEKAKDSSRDAEKAVFRIMARQNEIRSKMEAIRLIEERIRIEEENLKRELGEGSALVGRDILHYENHTPLSSGGEPLSEELILKEDRHVQEERRRAIEKIKIRLEDSGALSSQDIVKEFQETSERDAFLAREIEDLEKSASSLKDLIWELGERLDTEFKEGIEKINKQFQNFFDLMFGGGRASLSVVRSKKGAVRTEADDLFPGEPEEELKEEEKEEGIDIDVSLPRKKIKGLMMLSGGERALTSIALIFAVSQVNPPPFIILDETDAALDEANSKKYGDMVENLARSSQLVLITHNRETMSRAGVIYGVTMDSGGTSKLLSIAFEEAVSVAK